MDEQIVNNMQQKISEQNQLISKQAKLIHELQNVVNDIIREVKKMQTTVPVKNDTTQRQEVLQAEEKQEHPRSGGVTSNEVSVEKFFYSGSGSPPSQD